jgi:tRNA (adenine22-N1)-methyltransferase
MRLTPRLQAIANQIPAGSIVADIGSDHAYIPVYLLSNHLTTRVIASDSRPGPLQAACENLKLFNVDKMAELRLGDGLEVLNEADQVDVIVIAGMGGETTISILDKGRGRLKLETRLVLQPMTSIGLVRTWLVENGFIILEEDIAQEGENYYEIIVAQFLNARAEPQRQVAFGPRLIANKHPLLKPMLEQQLGRIRRAISSATQADSKAASDRVLELQARAEDLEEVLSWL